MANHIIEVRVDDKIASVVGDPLYVCGNSDYDVRFTFDAEWDDHDVKTARFVKSNKEYVDVVFAGNQCTMPILENTRNVKIGVYAGNLSTTTPAVVNAQRSILCGSGLPQKPQDDVYAQIMSMLTYGVSDEQIAQAVEAYMADHPSDGVNAEEVARAVEEALTDAKNSGEFDGAKGDPGVSVTHSWNGTTLTVTSASGTSSANLKGEKGDAPVRGTDYWTESDQQQIIQKVMQELPEGDGLPTGGTAHQQLVTDADGNATWEDKLCYTERFHGVILPESELSLSEEVEAYVYVGQLTNQPFSGANATVIYNGVTYNCVSSEIEEGGLSMIVLGNASLFGGEYSDEPFLIVFVPEEMLEQMGGISVMFIPLDGAESVTLSIACDGEAVKKIDKKYIPTGAQGERGFSILKCVVAPESYTAEVGNVTSSYRFDHEMLCSLCNVKKVLVGDVFLYSHYLYPVIYVDEEWVYLDRSESIRGATGTTAAITGISINVDNNTGVPSATVTAGGTASSRTFTFHFKNLKGEKGDKGDKGDPGESGSGEAVTVPSYWQDHLNTRLVDIRNALESAGWNKSAFLWYTDAHWSDNSKVSPKLLRWLYRYSGINRINYGGDIINAESADVTDMSYVYEWRDLIRDLPHHSVAGNHDDGNEVDDRWTKEAIYSFLLMPEESHDIVRGSGGLYYYSDSPSEKTRYIYLDSATKTGNIYYDTDQQSFVREALKSTPAGWHIVAIAHIWINVNYDVTPPVATTPSYGGQWMLDLFDSYNTRQGEFSECGATVEFCIGGHAHVDGDYTSATGIPVILTECDNGNYVRSGLTATVGTITESSVNAIIADYSNSQIHVIRIGRGESRTVPINHNVPTTYTNQLPIATDADGNVYNGTGFKADTRFSTSSAAETTATGWYLTGFIPCKRNDVVRLQGIEFMDMDGSLGGTSRAQIYLYDANKAYYSCSTNYTPSAPMPDAWEAVYGDDGNLIQFKLPSTYDASVVYIRIGAAHIDENSIITVNEVIA